MKLRKFMVASAAFIMILGLLVVVPVHAEVTFDSWVGMWMEGSVTDKGLSVDVAADSETERQVEKTPTFGYVQCWDLGTMTFTAYLIQQDPNGNWMDAVPFTVQVINNNPLDYISYAFIPPMAAPGIEVFALIVNATGREDKDEEGALSKGKIRTVGGAVVYDRVVLDNSYFAAEESLKLKLVPEDKVDNKVPQEVMDKCPQCTPCP